VLALYFLAYHVDLVVNAMAGTASAIPMTRPARSSATDRMPTSFFFAIA
jgi:hypothetical protein